MVEVIEWIDSHCHLGHGSEAGADEAAVSALVEARSAGVVAVIDVGTDPARSERVADRAARLEGVHATAGVHPHDAAGGLEGIEALLGRPEVVAVGEAGLDYHYDHSPRRVQREVFAAQVVLANRHRLPLVIHTREAWEDTFAVLDAEGVPERTVFHCFTGGPAEARGCLDRGAFVSISGIVTFRNAEDLRDAVRLVPIDRLLVETDAPFLAPVPHRGRTNRPALVPVVGRAVAALKGVEVAELAAVTTRSARSLFGLGER